MAQGFFYGSLPPSLQQSYLHDPRELLAQQLQSQGSSTAPLRGGAVEGVLRLANALVGARNQKLLGEQYQARGDQYNKGLAEALAGIKPGGFITDEKGNVSYQPTDTTSLTNFSSSNPDASGLAQDLQVAQLNKYFGQDAAIAAAQAKRLYDPPDYLDPRYREFELNKIRAQGEALGPYRLLGPLITGGATLYGETGNPGLLNMALHGMGGVGGAAPQGVSSGVPQGAPLPVPQTAPAGSSPTQLQGPGAGLNQSGFGLPVLPPKASREQMAKDQADDVASSTKAGAAATDFLSKVPLYDDAVKNVGYTGPGAELLFKGKQIAHAVAPDTFKDPVPENLVDNLNKQLTLASTIDPDGKRIFAGNFSDADRDFISAAAAGLGDTREGLVLKYELVKRAKQREAAMGELAQRFQNNPAGFAAAKQQFMQQSPFDDAFKASVQALMNGRQAQMKVSGGGQESPLPPNVPPGSKFLGFE